MIWNTTTEHVFYNKIKTIREYVEDQLKYYDHMFDNKQINYVKYDSKTNQLKHILKLLNE